MQHHDQQVARAGVSGIQLDNAFVSGGGTAVVLCLPLHGSLDVQEVDVIGGLEQFLLDIR